jgi:uncharacterized metal-binding protein
MPAGKTHAAIWKIGYVAVLPSAYAMYYWTDSYVPLTAGYLIGYTMGAIISPDWDLMAITKDESNAIRLPIIGTLLYGLSSMYGALFRNHHRSIWTHFPVISTAIRMTYLFWLLGLAYYLNWIVYQEWQLYIGIGVFLGMSLSDTFHWAADMIVSDVKRATRKSAKRSSRKPLTKRRK